MLSHLHSCTSIKRDIIITNSAPHHSSFALTLTVSVKASKNIYGNTINDTEAKNYPFCSLIRIIYLSVVLSRLKLNRSMLLYGKWNNAIGHCNLVSSMMCYLKSILKLAVLLMIYELLYQQIHLKIVFFSVHKWALYTCV